MASSRASSPVDNPNLKTQTLSEAQMSQVTTPAGSLGPSRASSPWKNGLLPEAVTSSPPPRREPATPQQDPVTTSPAASPTRRESPRAAGASPPAGGVGQAYLAQRRPPRSPPFRPPPTPPSPPFRGPGSSPANLGRTPCCSPAAGQSPQGLSSGASLSLSLTPTSQCSETPIATAFVIQQLANQEARSPIQQLANQVARELEKEGGGAGPLPGGQGGPSSAEGENVGSAATEGREEVGELQPQLLDGRDVGGHNLRLARNPVH